MSLSLVMPIHNAARFLSKTLSSVHEALRQDDQLILILDGCTDNTEAALRSWMSAHSDSVSYEINVDVGSYGGVAHSRNRGISLASRNWIGFIDHDDSVAPSIYKTLTDKAASSGADVVRSGYVKRTAQSFEVVYPDLAPEAYSFFGIFVWNSIFSKALIVDNGISFLPGYGEDYEFNLEVSKSVSRQAFVREPLYFWHIHDFNQHKVRRPVDFAARAAGIFQRHQSYLAAVPNAEAAFYRWLRDYSSYLGTQFPPKEVADALEVHGITEILSLQSKRS